jgi:hypothetical protein
VQNPAKSSRLLAAQFTRARDLKKHEIRPCYRGPETFFGLEASRFSLEIIQAHKDTKKKSYLYHTLSIPPRTPCFERALLSPTKTSLYFPIFFSKIYSGDLLAVQYHLAPVISNFRDNT